MDFKIIAWNIRSMNKLKKQMEVRNLILEEKLQVCAILETHIKINKMQKVCEKVFGSWCWASNADYSPNGCRIIVGWNKEMVNLMVLACNRQSVLCLIEIGPNKVKTFCSFVYASNTGKERRDLWTELIRTKQIIRGHPWLVLGDFNVTLKAEEHSVGGSKTTIDMMEFSECVNEVELADLSYSERGKMECQMEAKDSMSDIISNLPPSIIQTMLTLMPMRDAFRTSILSKNWKYHCVNMPKLKFDDQVFQGIASKNLTIKYKLLYIVYPILLLHQGPILDFSLSLSQLSSCCEIDQIIRHLSNNATVKNFNLCIKAGDEHKLLPSFFTLQQLEYLKLENCAFKPPSSFKGFSKLIGLSFYNVSITSKVLLRFILNCPLLKEFTLIGDEKHFLECWNSDFVELFECLPSVEYLCMSSYPIKCFATGVMPQKLPTSLVHLGHLNISGLCFAREIELRSALFLTTCSPNIKRIEMEMCYNPKEAVSQAAMNFLDLQDYSYVTFAHLREIKITNFTKMKPLMDFVKLILAKSPILRFVVINIDERVDINDENQMLKELIQYQRASNKAQIIFARPVRSYENEIYDF